MIKKIIRHYQQGTLWLALRNRLLGTDKDARNYRRKFRNIASHMFSYENNKREILAGKIPDRYAHLASLVPGRRVLEIGAGEGILALTLAKTKEKVYALDISPFRHQTAKKIQDAWQKKGIPVENCEMILGDVFDHIDLLPQVETVVAVRVIYHFQRDIDRIMEAIRKHAKYLVLAGNAEKAALYQNAHGQPNHPLGNFLRFATKEGMVSLLEQYGYRIVQTVEQGDPIVIGEK